jgi:hypothetical protein
MKEIIEFRMLEKVARLFLGDNEGKRIGFSKNIRVFCWNTADGRESLFRRANEKLVADGHLSGLYVSWSVKRTYSRSELEASSFFKLSPMIWMGPTGEECGTGYDEESACPHCGSGAKQISPLYLTPSRLPKTRDFLRTIAGELAVSRRVAELVHTHRLTGLRLLPIFSRSKPDSPLKEWFQLAPDDAFYDIVPPALAGNGPFDIDDERYKCSACGLLGLNLLSEVFAGPVVSQSGASPDFAWSRQFFGVRRGLLRPEQVIIVSKRARELMVENGMRGMTFEVAHSIEDSRVK